jgi:hypothetical protein
VTAHRDTYLGRDYGSHLRQVQEREELCGLAPEPDERLAGWEQDLQDDLARERGIDTTTLRRAA